MKQQRPAGKKMQKAKKPSTVPGKPSGMRHLYPWLIALLIAVITWYVYRPSLTNGFTNWDDPSYVLENRQVKQLNAENVKYFFTHPSATNYHPLTMISLGLDYSNTIRDKQVFRETDDLEGYLFHRTSLFLHMANGILVFFFVFLLTGKRLVVASATALLFALHPMHVESVSWIAERKDVLYSVFFLAGLITYLKYLERKKWYWIAVTAVLFIASLLSKPAAVVFPLILLAIDYYKGRRFTVGMIAGKLPFFILALVFGVVTYLVQVNTAVAKLEAFSIFQRVLFASYGFIMYQVRLLVPVNTAAFYPYPAVSGSGSLPLVFYLAPVITFLIAGLVAWSVRNTRLYAFGYLFFFFSVMLVLQFMPVGSAIMADRYTYLSAIGLFFILARGVDAAFTGKWQIFRALRWAVAAGFIVYVAILGRMTRAQSLVWKDSLTLWTDVIEKYPAAYTAYKNRGNYYGRLNDTDRAMADFLTFIRLKQDDAGIYSNLGNIYGLKGEFDKALESYSKSVALDSTDYKTFLNRGITYAKARRFDEALADYARSISLEPGVTDIYMNRAYTLLEMGRLEDAIRDFTLLIQNNPRNDNYFINRGIAFYRLTRFPEARADFEQAVALNPGNGNGYFNLAVVFNELKDFRTAYTFAKKAESLGHKVDAGFMETLKSKSK